jgi:hypothetical protein
MTDLEFQQGLKVFWSSGGTNPDEDTLEVWFQMIQHIPLAAYQFAIKGILSEEEDLATINFTKQIKDRAKMFDQRRGSQWKEQFEKPADAIAPEKALGLIKDFNKKLKGIEDASHPDVKPL